MLLSQKYKVFIFVLSATSRKKRHINITYTACLEEETWLVPTNFSNPIVVNRKLQYILQVAALKDNMIQVSSTMVKIMDISTTKYNMHGKSQKTVK